MKTWHKVAIGFVVLGIIGAAMEDGSKPNATPSAQAAETASKPDEEFQLDLERLATGAPYKTMVNLLGKPVDEKMVAGQFKHVSWIGVKTTMGSVKRLKCIFVNDGLTAAEYKDYKSEKMHRITLN